MSFRRHRFLVNPFYLKVTLTSWPHYLFMIRKVQRGAMRVYKMAQYAGSFFCVKYWTPQQPANRILHVFQFYVLRGRAWISKLCNGTYRSRVMALYSYWTAARSSWDLERHGSHAVPTWRRKLLVEELLVQLCACRHALLWLVVTGPSSAAYVKAPFKQCPVQPPSAFLVDSITVGILWIFN